MPSHNKRNVKFFYGELNRIFLTVQNHIKGEAGEITSISLTISTYPLNRQVYTCFSGLTNSIIKQSDSDITVKERNSHTNNEPSGSPRHGATIFKISKFLRKICKLKCKHIV